MQKNIPFTDLQPSYRYMRLPNGQVDVQIFEFVKEEQIEDQTNYIYNMNEFRINQKDLSESAIQHNPLSYLEYSPLAADSFEKIREEMNLMMEMIASGV